jgi:hypothetical protein
MQTSNWSRGLFGTADQDMSDKDMRVSDAERQAVADRLAVHYADGRLDQAEFDERTGRAISAKTRADLDGLLDDLPEPPGTLGTGPAGAPGSPAFSSGSALTRRHHGHPLLAVAIVVVIILSLGHAFWLFASWLWIGVIALIVLAATGHLGHHHHHHHHDPQRVEDDI